MKLLCLAQTNMRFYLLCAEESDAIRIAFAYTNPQRLDVFYHSNMGTLSPIQPNADGELVFQVIGLLQP